MMRWVWALALAGVALSAARAEAQSVSGAANSPADALFPNRPIYLADDTTNMYPQLGQGPDEAINRGGVHFHLNGSYLSNYIYRGIDQSTLGHSPENALQFNGEMNFDLGKLPHPFIGLFVNVFNQDPISRFEEVRPYGGVEWTIRPLIISGGINSYLYPNRKPLDTQEVWAKLQLDDSLPLRIKRPILSPYIYAAYDVAKYQGFYFEVGVHHDFVFEDIGVTLTPTADIAYVLRDPQFSLAGRRTDTGFQHYNVGLIGSYSLNTLFNAPARYGQWSLEGYLYYSDGLANHLRADTRIWGGVGISFYY